jgi:hypothetical protein
MFTYLAMIFSYNLITCRQINLYIVSRNGEGLTVEVPLIAIRKAENVSDQADLGWC